MNKKVVSMFLNVKWVLVFIFLLINHGMSSGVTDADVRVLEVDGGGIRGAYAAGALGLIHNDLGNGDLDNNDGRRICDFFKGGMSGTSTGSFIVLALAAKFHKIRDGEQQSIVEGAPQGFADGPYTPKEIGDFYDTMGDQIFKCWTPTNCFENCCDCPTDMCSILSTCFWNMFTCGGCFACCYNCNGFCGPK